MNRILKSLTIFVLLLAAGDGRALADNTGAIKRFKKFPVTTYDEHGNYSDIQLTQASTPPAEHIAVDGWWPDKKMLLITFGGESYFILYSAVVMADQDYWDGKMAATGGVQCNYGKTRGAAPQKSTAATKRFASPC